MGHLYIHHSQLETVSAGESVLLITVVLSSSLSPWVTWMAFAPVEMSLQQRWWGRAA